MPHLHVVAQLENIEYKPLRLYTFFLKTSAHDILTYYLNDEVNLIQACTYVVSLEASLYVHIDIGCI